MKRFIGAILLAFMAAASASADVFEYEPGPFDRILVRGDLDVIYLNNPDSAGYVRYESQHDFSDVIDLTCSKGKLSVVVKMSQEDNGKLPTLYMYSGYLVGITNEGNGTLEADMHLATPTLSLKQIGNGKIVCDGINTTELAANIETGNGTIVARGKCRNAKYTLTGAGVIQADELAADEVNCMTLGTGTIGCRPADSLDVRGLGTTKIYYHGNPTIKKVGAAKLEKMPEADQSVVEQ